MYEGLWKQSYIIGISIAFKKNKITTLGGIHNLIYTKLLNKEM